MTSEEMENDNSGLPLEDENQGKTKGKKRFIPWDFSEITKVERQKTQREREAKEKISNEGHDVLWEKQCTWGLNQETRRRSK